MRVRVSKTSLWFLAANFLACDLASAASAPDAEQDGLALPGADLDALSLADETSENVARPKNWRLAMEAAAGRLEQRFVGESIDSQRLSLDFSYDSTFATGWRAVFADRLDSSWQDHASTEVRTNTLKEAYLSWQPSTTRTLDLGRINQRTGVAVGYNPTDYFRDGAIRSLVSADPASLRNNRLGTVMLRGQQLWQSGALSLLYAPRLSERVTTETFDPDFGATNNANRWLVSLTQQLTRNVAPQWLVYAEEGSSPQFGFNVTTLLGEATVAYFEWSGGRSRSLLSQAFGGSDDSAFRDRISTGFTYTSPRKLSLTLEYQANGAGLDKADFRSLSRTDPARYFQYRGFALRKQDPPTKQSLFVFSTWQDAVIGHLDLTGFVRYNLSDRSRMSWLEARYHWTSVDVALQWQSTDGTPGSEFGALPLRSVARLVFTYFL